MKLSISKKSLVFTLLLSFFLVQDVLSSGLENYKAVSLEGSVESLASEQMIVLSAPKRISNTLSIEKQEFVAGDVESRLYRLKSGVELSQAFDYYLESAAVKGEILFQCKKRACGSSNYWANKIFDEHKLYGRDSDQYYVASRALSKGKEVWSAVYFVQNGLRQRFIYELTVTKSSAAGGDYAEPVGVWLNGSSMGEGDVTKNQAEAIARYIESVEASELYLVVYADQELKPTKVLWDQLRTKGEVQVAVLSESLGQAKLPITLRVLGPLHGEPSFEKLPVWFRLYAY